MKTKKKINENIDILGAKWALAPGGRDLVDKCQERVSDLHIEIAGYGALFRNLNSCDFSVDELYGISLVLMRVSKRLGRIHDLLGRITIETNKDSNHEPD